MADPLRIDDNDLDAGRAQGFRPAPLITAARLHHRPADPVRAHPRNQLGLSCGADKRRPAERMQASALLFATSRPTTRVFCGILRSLPCSCGLSRPCNGSGLRKTPDLSLASPQVPPLGITGSDPATGGCSSSRPFANSVTFSGHKGNGALAKPQAAAPFLDSTILHGCGAICVDCHFPGRVT